MWEINDADINFNIVRWPHNYVTHYTLCRLRSLFTVSTQHSLGFCPIVKTAGACELVSTLVSKFFVKIFPLHNGFSVGTVDRMFVPYKGLVSPSARVWIMRDRKHAHIERTCYRPCPPWPCYVGLHSWPILPLLFSNVQLGTNIYHFIMLHIPNNELG